MARKTRTALAHSRVRARGKGDEAPPAACSLLEAEVNSLASVNELSKGGAVPLSVRREAHFDTGVTSGSGRTIW